jgi:formate hydrogenlyase subunit 3/multisubunit Na+/H+ antiporter MnhD subunit
VSDPILLFLTVDVVALLLLGTFAAALPLAACGFLATILSGLGMLLCLPPLLTGVSATELALPIGPPGLSLHLAFDPLSAFFLFVVFLAATAITAFQATTTPLTPAASVRTTTFCLAGTAFALLAADGVALAVGLAVTCGAIWLPQRSRFALLIPLLMLAATCLLAPAGFPLHFDTIRPAPVDPSHASAAAALTIAAVTGLAGARSGEPNWTADALTAGVLMPSGAYLLLRLVAGQPGSATPAWCGFVLLLAGAAFTVIQGWRAAAHPDIDGSVLCLAQRQAGLAMAGIGLALIARAADLPGAASFALAAAFLSVIGGGVAGVVTTLAAQAIAASAGTYRLSRLGGLVHAMPATSAALAVGLLGLSAIPPGLGFASLWLLFEALLSAPRTGGLLFQLPMALLGAAIALSAALATAGSVRVIGIAVLGRPRTPRGAGAGEAKSPSRPILLVLSSLSALAGVLPGSTLWLLADPAIRGLTGAHTGLAWVSPSTTTPGYLALPVLALLALTTGGVMLATRWSHKEANKPAGLWTDGMAPPVGLPFGEPAAQSAGQGFLPPRPYIALPARPRLPAFPRPRPPSVTAGLWLVLAGFAALLLVLAVTS